MGQIPTLFRSLQRYFTKFWTLKRLDCRASLAMTRFRHPRARHGDPKIALRKYGSNPHTFRFLQRYFTKFWTLKRLDCRASLAMTRFRHPRARHGDPLSQRIPVFAGVTGHCYCETLKKPWGTLSAGFWRRFWVFLRLCLWRFGSNGYSHN